MSLGHGQSPGFVIGFGITHRGSSVANILAVQNLELENADLQDP